MAVGDTLQLFLLQDGGMDEVGDLYTVYLHVMC